MARSKKQRRIAAQDKKDARNFLKVVVISTLILVVLLYFMFSNT